jgi:peptidoglycan biosynthesis protein MviN/MurJ (putative lipid II flippase)
MWIGAGLTSLYVAQNADVFVAGHVIHRAADVGFYTTSWRLTFLMVGVVSITVTSVVFPALSRTAHEPMEFRATLLTAVRQSAFVVLPSCLYMAVVAPVLVTPLLGGRWASFRSDSIVISILALYGGERALTGVFLEGYKAVGKPWIMTAYNSIKAAVLFPAMIVAAPYGIRALALVYIPVGAVELPVALWIARSVLDTAIADIWLAVRSSSGSALVSGALAFGVERACLAVVHTGDGVALIACTVVAVVTYVCVVWVVDRGLLRETRGVLVAGLAPRERSRRV